MLKWLVPMEMETLMKPTSNSSSKNNCVSFSFVHKFASKLSLNLLSDLAQPQIYPVLHSSLWIVMLKIISWVTQNGAKHTFSIMKISMPAWN